MAKSKPATQKPRKRTGSGTPNGSAPKATKSSSRRSTKSAAKSKTTATARGNGSKPRSKSGSGRAKSQSRSRSSAAAAKRNASPTATDRAGQMAETAKQVAGKAKGPAVAVGAAAVGVAGGLALKSRLRRPRVLGVPLPRALKPSNLDARSLAKTVGDASQRFAKTSKSVSRDIERAGDGAERIGKILS